MLPRLGKYLEFSSVSVSVTRCRHRQRHLVFRGRECSWAAVGGYGDTDDLSRFVNTRFICRSCYIHQVPTVYSLEVQMPTQTSQKRNEGKWSSLWNRVHLCCVCVVPNLLRPADPQQIFWRVTPFAFVLSLFAAVSCSVFKAKASVDSCEKARWAVQLGERPPTKFRTLTKRRFILLPKHSPRTPASWQPAFQIMLSYPEWRKAASPRSEPRARPLFPKDERPPEGS